MIRRWLLAFTLIATVAACSSSGSAVSPASSAIADLAKLTGLDPATFSTVRAEQVIWSDGSLGCPLPGYLYVQVQTSGYWIQLKAGDKTYDYRSPVSGPVRRCDQPSPKPPSG